MKNLYQKLKFPVMLLGLSVLFTNCNKDLPFNDKDDSIHQSGLRSTADLSITYKMNSQQTRELLAGPAQNNPYWDPQGMSPVYKSQDVDLQLYADCSFQFNIKELDPTTCSNGAVPAFPFVTSKGVRTVITPNHVSIYDDKGSLILHKNISIPPVCISDFPLRDGAGNPNSVIPFADVLAGSLDPQAVADYIQTVTVSGGTVTQLEDDVLGIRIPAGTVIGGGTPSTNETHLLMDTQKGRPLGSTLYDQSGNMIYQRFIRWSDGSPSVMVSSVERSYSYYPNGTQTVTQTMSDYENVKVITQ